MAGTKAYALVEGRGEVKAAQNLLVRLSRDQGLGLVWAPPLYWPNLHQWEAQRRGGVKAGAEFIRSKRDAGALLILRDEDDACPKQTAPAMAARLVGLGLPFPVAYVLLHPEYEVLFLPCMSRMQSVGFPAELSWDKPSWEARRGIKEWLSARLPRGRRYKPTVQQLAMTRKVDFETLRAAEVPSFGSLERGLRFLAGHLGQGGGVYPDPEAEQGR